MTEKRPNESSPGGESSLGKLVSTTFSSLKHRNFRWYSLGVIASLTGSLMQEIVVAWVAYQMTGSSFVLGSILFSYQIPMLLVSIAGGWAADRLNRKRIIVVTQILALIVSLTWLTLSATGLLQLWHLYALSAVFGTIVAFEIPARFAIIPQLVSDEDTLNAFSLDSLLFYSGRVLGPAVAAVMLAVIGPTGCFAVNACTYVFELVTLAFIRPRAVDNAKAPSLMEGLRFTYGTPSLRRLLLLVAVLSFCGVYIPLMPVFTDMLHGTASTNGFLIAASEMGAMVASLILAYLTADHTKTGRLLRYIGLAGLSYAAFMTLFAVSRNPIFSMALMIPVGFSMTIALIGSHAVIQSKTEDRMRGVVSTVFWMYSYFGMFALGGPTLGWLVEKVGATATVAGAAAACAVATALFIVGQRREAKEAERTPKQ
jgi:MFS family permease